MTRRGFSFLEFLVALVFLATALVSLIWMNSYSNRGTQDTYYRSMAMQLAQEPLEVFQAMGYSSLKARLAANPSQPLAQYPIGETAISPSVGGADGSPLFRPAEASSFKRRIQCDLLDGQFPRAIRVVVTVLPKELNWLKGWISGSNVTVESLIIESLP